MKRTIQLRPVVSLASFELNGEIVAINVGSDGIVYLVVALLPLDYRTVRPSGASFIKTVAAQPQRYRVLGLLEADLIRDIWIEHEPFNIHDVQPLLNELLLVCARSHYRGPRDYELNGRVYSDNGKFSREFLLGDGIRTVQATSAGLIWTSYFDEGVFGNFGWRDPVGASGLVAWDPAGNKNYEFQPGPGLDSICDCYAMNVCSDRDVWLYYYTDFPLVHLRDFKVKATWDIPIAGSDAIAIAKGYALFRGGYKSRDEYQLFQLQVGGEAKLVSAFEFCNVDGEVITADRVVARGGSMYLLAGDLLYRVDVEAILPD